jgi:hypothetical protein
MSNNDKSDQQPPEPAPDKSNDRDSGNAALSVDWTKTFDVTNTMPAPGNPDKDGGGQDKK